MIVPPTPPISSQGGNSSSAPLYYQQGLPPGYFNLKHGFPEWSTESPVPSRTPNKHLHPNDQLTAASSKRLPPDPPLSPATAATKTLRNKRSYRSLKAERPGDLGGDRSGSSAPLLSILHYLKSTFSDEAVLDDISPNLAANITAWKAWKEHQSSLNASETEEEDSEDDSPPRSIARTAWEDKVSSCVEGSKSEGVLFGGLGLGRAGGGMAGEELVRNLCTRIQNIRFAFLYSPIAQYIC